MRWLKTILDWLVAVAVTVIAASAWHSWSVQSQLIGLGAEISPALRLTTAASDLVGLAPALLPVFGAALALGFALAAFLRPRLPALADIAYPLAGAAAVATALGLMGLQFETVPLAGARGALGFAILCAAGALGGLVFSWRRA